ncbi:hypothetical protein KRM28CT15_19560 [Krasilnikovia sp. M28-CT-15]
MPLPPICITALKEHREAQIAAKEQAGAAWHDDGLVVTTRFGTPIEPRNFLRFWDRRCELAGLRRITAHDARRTWDLCWPTWTCTPGWRCRFSGTPTSRSRWRLGH